MKKTICCSLLLVGIELVSQECCSPTTEISFPCYEGGFEVDGSWVYLKPIATDGDLEFGSFITLTVDPPNLNALLLETNPSFQSGYDLGLGYFFSCTNQSAHVRYFSYRASGKNRKNITSLNELIQNFLGASYSTSQGRSKQKIDQASLSYRFDSMIDQVAHFNLFLGVTYANIRRDFNVKFTDLVLNPTPSELTGKEKSRYWGVGPLIGVEFVIPLMCHLGVAGKLETGVLFGKNRSRLSSNSFRNNTQDSFFSKHSHHPIVTNLNGDLGLNFNYPFACNFGIEIEAGYQVRYYFKPINRINPFNGYVNNPNTFSTNKTSNLGLGGPYIFVALSTGALPSCLRPISCCHLTDSWISRGPTFEFTSFWLQPRPTNDDLVFAILNTQSGQKNLQIHPDTTWASQYKLGYHFCQTLDLSATAFFLHTTDSKQVSTNTGESISSVNASALSNVVFTEASSRVKYKIDQYDGTFGKTVQLFNCLNLHGGVGLSYLRQERTLTNGYFGGTPPLVTQTKFPKLKSRYIGIGPLFTFEPAFGPFWNFELVGKLGLAFFIGKSKATLDQDNFGVLGFSSNDLRTPKSPFIAPAFEGSGGLRWNVCFSCAQIGVEGGYQYLAYYRTVRLLLPTLLTGLEQINSNLILQGPYVRGQMTLSF